MLLEIFQIVKTEILVLKCYFPELKSVSYLPHRHQRKHAFERISSRRRASQIGDEPSNVESSQFTYFNDKCGGYLLKLD